MPKGLVITRVYIADRATYFFDLSMAQRRLPLEQNNVYNGHDECEDPKRKPELLSCRKKRGVRSQGWGGS